MKRIFKSTICILLIMIIFSASFSAMAAGVVKVMRTNVAGARMRTGQHGAELKPSLPKGTRVLFLNQTSGSYWKVVTSDGRQGFVFRDYLSNYGACKASNVYYVTSSSLVMRSHPNDGASRVQTLKNKQVVIVFKKSDSWGYGRTLDGRGGYFRMSGLSKASI